MKSRGSWNSNSEIHNDDLRTILRVSKLNTVPAKTQEKVRAMELWQKKSQESKIRLF